jgi:rhamnulokinase
MFISSGTWSLVGTEVAEPVLTAQAQQRAFTNESGVNGSVRLLKNVAGLWLLAECRREWALEGHNLSWEQLLALNEQAQPFGSLIDPGAETFLNPESMPEAIRAACHRHGEREPKEMGALIRCCLESLALKYRSVLEDLEVLTGNSIDVVRIVGGGSQNTILCQYTANACNRPVIAGPVEATALGNVMVQALVQGFLPDLKQARRVAMTSSPQTIYKPQEVSAWEDAFGRFQNLYL